MPEKQLKTQPYSQIITQQVDLVDSLVKGVASGWIAALKSDSPSRPSTALGTERYINIIENETHLLVPFGFEKTERTSQVRFESADKRFSMPVRFIFCKGKKCDCLLKVNRKGSCTEELVRENFPYNSQQALFEHSEIDEPIEIQYQNYFVAWEAIGFTGEDIAVYLALPEKLDASGRVLRCSSEWELVELFRGNVFDVTAGLPDFPEGAKITPGIEEMESTHDEE